MSTTQIMSLRRLASSGLTEVLLAGAGDLGAGVAGRVTGRFSGPTWTPCPPDLDAGFDGVGSSKY